jgi:hypothetical protein
MWSNADNGPIGDDIESDIANSSVSAENESSCLMSECSNVESSEKDLLLESGFDSLQASLPVASAVKNQAGF